MDSLKKIFMFVDYNYWYYTTMIYIYIYNTLETEKLIVTEVYMKKRSEWRTTNFFQLSKYKTL